ncbi:hypothetical protein HS088_TW10G00202 [Tripterygium wilfordii]|uniref:RING finger protein n=1 Tax=Tripterygium wilfordii TaxID=458696 RepID=A0A7J7D571_TRIWF|nr:protein LAX PANICLE 2-like isoform X2 [Tripterygium wilfordii]KAF5741206.1 hypothetical protein HS088_TW10G00202 [Tripterygium wilfordii]
MTMVPAQTLSKHHQLYYGGYDGCDGGYTEEEEYYEAEAGLLGRSDLVLAPAAASNPMAEDESRTTTTNYTTSASLNNNEAAASSSKVVQAEDDASWLQLSIGASAKTTPRRGGGGLVELDLLPARSGSEGERVISEENITRVLPAAAPLTPIFHAPPGPVPSFLFQAAGSSSSTVVPSPPPHHHQENINWVFRPAELSSIGTNSLSSASSSNPASFMQLGSYFARTPFQLQGGGVNVAGPSLQFRVIDPPTRPHSGIWFSLQASQNQAKEPFLPQIPKSYLRIRDGRMTVRLLMKYLVNKLRLDSESEVEITCRGQELLPFLTLQHVRDNIWNPRDALTLLPDSSTIHHLMVLQYGRNA